MKTTIDFKYDTLAFKQRKEFRSICEKYLQYYRDAKGCSAQRIVLPKDVYMSAREKIASVKYADSNASFYYDSVPVFGFGIDA